MGDGAQRGASRGRALRQAARAALSGRRAPWLAALAGVLVALPSLAGGLVADDHFQRATVRAQPALGPVMLELFGTPNRPPHDGFVRARDFGRAAWYARDDFQVAFHRPLAAATHWLDYRCFDGAPWLMHLQSVAWYAAAIAAVYAVLARAGRVGRASPSDAPARAQAGLVAGLGALLYAVDDSHLITVAWLSNRNALMALLFGALALVAHDRWVRDGQRRLAWLAPLALYASLLSAELGVSTLAYLAAHAACLDRAPARRRALHLLPYAAVTLLWRASWSALGFGARGSSLYLDPLASPVAFARAAVQRAPILLGAALGAPHADWTAFVSGRAIALGALASALALAALAWIVRPLLRSSAAVRFHALGAALAVIPVCGVQPSDRNLAFVGLGVAGLLAELIVASAREAPRPGRALRLLGGGAFALHLGVLPLLFVLQTPPLFRAAADTSNVGAQRLYAAAPPDKAIVVLRGLDLFSCTRQISIASFTSARPRLALCLTGGPSATTVQRLDARTLLVRPDGGFLDAGTNRLHWDGHAAKVGETYENPVFRAEITELTADGEPQAVAFRFFYPVDHPGGAWLVWRVDHYERVTLPEVGGALRIVDGVVTPS